VPREREREWKNGNDQEGWEWTPVCLGHPQQKAGRRDETGKHWFRRKASEFQESDGDDGNGWECLKDETSSRVDKYT